MTRRKLYLVLGVSVLGMQACALPKAIETYDAKPCAEIRKLAQEQFLGRTPVSRPGSNDSNANEFLEAIFQGNERIDSQAKSTSYNRRCR